MSVLQGGEVPAPPASVAGGERRSPSSEDTDGVMATTNFNQRSSPR